MSKNHQFLRFENFEEIFSFSLNFAESHRSEFLSYGTPKDTNRKDFVHTFTLLNLRARQRYLHTPGTSIWWYKITISTFPLISAYTGSQTTNEILHKNVSNHTKALATSSSVCHMMLIRNVLERLIPGSPNGGTNLQTQHSGVDTTALKLAWMAQNLKSQQKNFFDKTRDSGLSQNFKSHNIALKV